MIYLIWHKIYVCDTLEDKACLLMFSTCLFFSIRQTCSVIICKYALQLTTESHISFNHVLIDLTEKQTYAILTVVVKVLINDLIISSGL